MGCVPMFCHAKVDDTLSGNIVLNTFAHKREKVQDTWERCTSTVQLDSVSLRTDHAYQYSMVLFIWTQSVCEDTVVWRSC